MSSQKLQVARALRVFPSDYCNIPNPAGLKDTGTNTSTASLKLIDSAGTFITNGVQVGDIVYNTTNSLGATVVSVDSEIQLTLNANIFTGVSRGYSIYDSESSNYGCVFYTGGAGTVALVTEGGDSLTKEGCNAGQYHPVHIIKILSTGTSATLIDAHW